MTTFYAIPETGGGTPTGDGSSGDPWNGLANVLYSGAAGVEVNAGDTLVLTGDFSDERLIPGVSGSSGSPVIFDLLNATLTHTSNSMVAISGRNYITVNDGTVGGVSNSNGWDVFVGNAENIIFNNTEFLDSDNECVRINLASSGNCANVEFNQTIHNSDIRIQHGSTHTDILDGFIVDNAVFNQCRIHTFHSDEVHSLITNDYRVLNGSVINSTFNQPPTAAIICRGWGGTVRPKFNSNTVIGCGTGGASLVNAVQTGYTLNMDIMWNTITGTTTSTDADGHCIILDHIENLGTFYPSDNCDVVGNYCTTDPSSSSTGRSGINIWRGKNSEVNGNKCLEASYGVKHQNAESTDNIIANNDVRNVSISGVFINTSSPITTIKNNVLKDGVNGIKIDTGGTSPTETHNIFVSQSGDSIINGATPVAVDSTSIETTTDPIDSNGIAIISGDADMTGTKWWTGANPQGFNGEPISDFDTDRGPNQSTNGPFHPKNL